MRHKIIKNVITAIIILSVGAGFWWIQRVRSQAPLIITPSPTKPTHETSSSAPTPDQSVMVYVVGEVNHPGMIQLPASSRAQDAIVLAGGLTPKADLTSVNLAAKCKDGGKIWVKAIKQSQSKSMMSTPSDFPIIHLNSASKEELMLVPGIGPKLAAAIVQHRIEHGYFRDIGDLAEVKGIREKSLPKIAQHLSL